MAAMDFTDRAVVLAYLTATLPTATTSGVEALLDASAGYDCDDDTTAIYRPFWVEANLRDTQRAGEFESVKSAAGSSVTYRDTAVGVRRSLLKRQALLDLGMCGIPDGYEANAGNRATVVF